MRISEKSRKTAETNIELKLNLDGSGKADVNTGCGFLDHMLTLFSAHGRFDLYVRCIGDTHVDFHHTVEDVAIVLGSALKEALGDKRGIKRYGSSFLPMDEALVLAVCDISGRSMLRYSLDVPASQIGLFDTELCEEFFEAFCRTSEMCVHLRKLDGKNSHHIIEGAFKGFGRALKEAVSIDESLKGEIPSTKGVL